MKKKINLPLRRTRKNMMNMRKVSLNSKLKRARNAGDPRCSFLLLLLFLQVLHLGFKNWRFSPAQISFFPQN